MTNQNETKHEKKTKQNKTKKNKTKRVLRGAVNALRKRRRPEENA